MAQEALGGLFGPTEDEIRQLIDEKGRADINTLYNNAPSGLRIAGANMAQSGRMLGGALETLSGYVDPRVEKARKMEMVKQSVLSTGITPDSDPIEFAKLSAREFARMGLGDEAFGAAMYAKQMQDEAEKFGWEKEAKQGDWRTELEKTRMMVEGQLQSARIHAAAGGGGVGKPFEVDAQLSKRYEEEAAAFLRQNPEVFSALGGTFGWWGTPDEDSLKSISARLSHYPAALAASKQRVGPNWLQDAINEIAQASVVGGGASKTPTASPALTPNQRRTQETQQAAERAAREAEANRQRNVTDLAIDRRQANQAQLYPTSPVPNVSPLGAISNAASGVKEYVSEAVNEAKENRRRLVSAPMQAGIPSSGTNWVKGVSSIENKLGDWKARIENKDPSVRAEIREFYKSNRLKLSKREQNMVKFFSGQYSVNLGD